MRWAGTAGATMVGIGRIGVRPLDDMDIVIALAGLLVLGVVVADVVATTISAGMPGGFLTRRIGLWLWHRSVHLARGRHRALQVAGLGIVLTIIAAWVGLIILGWALVLIPLGGIEHGSTGLPASWADGLYYAGYTVSTMGNGDLVATTAIGRAATVLASVSGLLTLTMCITYLVPVLSATAQKPQLAATLYALGPTPGQVAQRLWPGGEVADDHGLTTDLAFRIREMTQQHYSYPVLHFLHSEHRRTAVAPGIAVLDEALHAALPHDCEDADADRRLPTPAHLLHEAIGEFLQSLAHAFIDTDVPEPPDTVVDDVPQRQQRVPRADRRRRLAAFCADDGWAWEDVTDPEPAPS